MKAKLRRKVTKHISRALRDEVKRLNDAPAQPPAGDATGGPAGPNTQAARPSTNSEAQA